jgi:hypothetical protein
MREPFAIALFLTLPALANGTQEPPAVTEDPPITVVVSTPATREGERGQASFGSRDMCATTPLWLARLGNCPLPVTDQTYVTSTGSK